MMTPIAPGPNPNEKTNVVVLITSTANDQLVAFSVAVSSLALVNESGNTITLFTSGGNNSFFQPAEFMHLNGASEPLVSATIPQGVYTSAVATVGGCNFTEITFTQNTLLNATYAEGLCGQGTGNATVNLASPLTISGSAMVLSLNFQVSQSFTLTGSTLTNNAVYTISPVFTLAPVALSASPTNDQNGKITGVEVQVTSIGANGTSFAVQTISGVSLNINSNVSTAFQGVSGVSALEAGMLLNVDGAIQSDGSLLATRVELNDSAATAVFVGPLFTPTAEPGVFTLAVTDCFPAGLPACDSIIHANDATVFSVSGEINNLTNLPFTANFSASNVFMGQNIASFTAGARDNQEQLIVTTVTLEPQTIDGTVMAVSNTGGFSVYTVALAPYDLIPTVQTYLGANANLNDPTTVMVYADSNTQFLDSGSIGAGSVLRFRGVIFDDNGTLRMDCVEVADGVPE